MTRTFRFERTDSTNERALAALAEGSARDGDLFVAHEQTKGRGSRGRSWESAPGQGLYVSRVHRPEASAAHPPAAITMAAGLAVLDVAHDLGLDRARLDWPNDVVTGGAKLAGILVESRGFDPAAPCFVVGIGINVAQRAFSPELLAERAVTSLALEGIDIGPEDALERLAPRLERRLRQTSGLSADYLAATGLRGERVRVRAGRDEVEGQLRSLDLALGLTLLTRAGERAFELAHVRAIEAFPRAGAAP